MSPRHARIAAFALFALLAAFALPPAVARAQWAIAGGASVADVLAALVGQDVASTRYTSSAATGAGFTCNSHLASCIKMPTADNVIGSNATQILLGPTASTTCQVKVGASLLFLCNGGIIANGQYDQYNAGGFARSIGGAVQVDDADGFLINPQAATPTCAAGNKGTHSVLTATGAAYYCDGTSAQLVARKASWSGSLNFAAVSAGQCDTLTFAATGAVLDETVACGGRASVIAGDEQYSMGCAISATDTAIVQLCCHNLIGDCANLAAITFSVTAVR